MERDTFIITVFCLVSEMRAQLLAQRPARHGGFAPALSDEEVVTIEICGECFKHHKDCDLYDYFAAHHRHFFPRLPNRSLFVRQAANAVARENRHPAVDRRAQRTRRQPRASD